MSHDGKSCICADSLSAARHLPIHAFRDGPYLTNNVDHFIDSMQYGAIGIINMRSNKSKFVGSRSSLNSKDTPILD